MRVGLVGTGYAAKLRAEALQVDSRAVLVAIAGHAVDRTQAFCQTYQAAACSSWQELVQRSDIELVIIATVNCDHGAIAIAALDAGKHVVVEYPLALEIAEAEAAIALAQAKQRLLHVEHIELLGGVHQALKASLPRIGVPFFARYTTLKPERPAPPRWSYNLDQFGFPLVGALSRLHRLIDAFGAVRSVSCQATFTPPSFPESSRFFTTCRCTAFLSFRNGVLAEVTYGKGEALWQAVRSCEIQGDQGALIFEGDRGTFIHSNGTELIEIGDRRGSFTKDTRMVLDYLLEGTPLYISPADSLYTLKVAKAAQRSAKLGRAIFIAPD